MRGSIGVGPSGSSSKRWLLGLPYFPYWWCSRSPPVAWSSSRHLIHDRDSKFCESFHRTIEAVGVAPVKLPARSPDLNSFAERWVESVKEECLSKLILFGEKSLRPALREYVVYHHYERNHQGKEKLLLFPASDQLPQSERCAPHKVDPALIPRVRPTIVGLSLP